MSSFDARGDLNWQDGLILVYQGKKRSGKSAAALVTFASFPGDRVVVDVAGDDGPEGPGVVELRGAVDELPRDWPEHLRPARDQPMILRYVPDPGSPTFLEDIDAVIGLAYKHSTKKKPVAILIHEIGVAAPVGRTQPHTRRMLMHNRHHGLVVLGCGPRSRTVDPLFLAQADLVYTFELPNPDDRQRTAETIGWNPQDFDYYVEQLKKHEYLRFDANEEKPEPCPAGTDPDIWAREHPDLRLVHLPALPADTVRQTLEWAHDVPAPAGAGW